MNKIILVILTIVCLNYISIKAGCLRDDKEYGTITSYIASNCTKIDQENTAKHKNEVLQALKEVHSKMPLTIVNIIKEYIELTSINLDAYSNKTWCGQETPWDVWVPSMR